MIVDQKRKPHRVGTFVGCTAVAFLLYFGSYTALFRFGVWAFAERRTTTIDGVKMLRIAGGGPFVEFSESSTINDAVRTFYRPAISIDRRIRRERWREIDPNNRL